MLVYLFRLFFAGYLYVTGALLEEVLVVFFKLERTWRSKVLGILAAFFLLGWFAGGVIVFIELSIPALVAVFSLSAIVSYVLYAWAKRNTFPEPQGKDTAIQSVLPNTHLLLGVLGYSILVVYGFYLLATSRTGASLSTPWQTINAAFIYVFAAATFVLGVLSISRLKTTWLLGLLVVHSLLLHSYLPLTHDLIYGADGWRHIATEQRILDGQSILQPALVDGGSAVLSISFLIGKFAYSHLWGISVLLAKVLGLSLLDVNKWLVPVVWSIALPVILFEIAGSLGWSKRLSMLFVWLSFLPFAWQAGGSFTLPVNLGFIIWLLLVLLICKRAEESEPAQLFILIGAGILSVFGYTLFTLLFWVAFLVFEYVRWKEDLSGPGVTFLVVSIALFLPVCEWVFGYSGIFPSVTFWEGLKQWIGNFSAYYLATGPRPHVISTGNVIFNQVPSYAFIGNYFVDFRWWLVAFMVFFLLIAAYGMKIAFEKGVWTLPALPGNPEQRQRHHFCWFLIFSTGLFVGYVISRYWLSGQHLLTRRLDPVLAFLLLTLFVMGISRISIIRRSRWLIAASFVIVTAAIAASYSLGPNTATASDDQYTAMRFVWQQESSTDKHCVLAETYPLLALEALSSNSIVGGGFPITSNFEQPDLTLLMNRVTRDVSILDVEQAFLVTGAPRCWIVVPKNINVSYFIRKDASSTPFGDLNVWKFSR